MKRIGIVLLGLSVSTALMAGQDKITQDASLLPEVCRTFMATHYQGTPVAHIEIERLLFWDSSYEVILTDGTSIDFNASGEWEDIEGRRPVPQALIPRYILEHMRVHYPAETVVSIERERKTYSIELTNGLELTFNSKGKLIEVD